MVRSAAQLAADQRMRERAEQAREAAQSVREKEITARHFPNARPITQPVRARASRQAETTQVRRRRKAGTLDRMAQYKLDIFAPEQLDLANYVYRWVNDEGANIRQATKGDDYDFVNPAEIEDFSPENESDSESADRVRMLVGSDKGGHPVYAYLCKKPRAYFEDDLRRNMEFRQDMMEGRVYRGELNDADDLKEEAYVPENVPVSLGNADLRRRGPVNPQA